MHSRRREDYNEIAPGNKHPVSRSGGPCCRQLPCSLQDGDAERLGEAAVQKDVSPNEHAPDPRVGHGAENLNPVVQLALLPHLLQEESLRTVAADDEVDVGVPLAHDLDFCHFCNRQQRKKRGKRRRGPGERPPDG